MNGTINGAEMLSQMQAAVLQGVTMVGVLGCAMAAVLLTVAVLAAGILRPAAR